MKYGLFFKLHSFAGLISGLFVLLMSISGATLVFRNQVDALQQPKIKPVVGNFAGVDAYLSSIQNKYPKAQISNCTLPNKNDAPVSFIIFDSSYKNGAKPIEVLLHPQTAVELPKMEGSANSKSNFMHWLSTFHRSFHLGKTGEWLLGFFALVFLISIITGIILFRKKIVAVLTFKKVVYNKYNLHQVVGVYALLFNLLIAGSGFWMQRYVFKKEFYSNSNYKPKLKTTSLFTYKLDSAINVLKKQYPDFTAHVIYFAQSATSKTAVYGSRSRNAYIHSKKFADVIFLDSVGAVSNTRFINEIDAADRFDIINSQLHIVDFGGWAIKILYFVFGLSGGFLSITGFILLYKRKNNRKMII